MPLRHDSTGDGDVVHLWGVVTVEETEELASLLRTHPGAAVDLDGCDHLHTAALQVLLAVRPTLTGEPAGAFLGQWVVPALAGAHPGGAPDPALAHFGSERTP